MRVSAGSNADAGLVRESPVTTPPLLSLAIVVRRGGQSSPIGLPGHFISAAAASLLPRVEAPRLIAIAARFHAAPAALLGTRGVDEEPAALRVAALADLGGLVGREDALGVERGDP